MIEALFESEDVIEDVNHAAELLVPKADGTWGHKFAKNPFTKLCKVCYGYQMDHLQERIIASPDLNNNMVIYSNEELKKQIDDLFNGNPTVKLLEGKNTLLRHLLRRHLLWFTKV